MNPRHDLPRRPLPLVAAMAQAGNEPAGNAALHANVHSLLNEQCWASGGWGAGNVGEARNYSLSLVAQF